MAGHVQAGADDDGRAVSLLEADQLLALAVLQVLGHGGRERHLDACPVALCRPGVDLAKNGESSRLHGLDHAVPLALAAGRVGRGHGGPPQALPRHLEEPQLADARHVVAGLVLFHRLAQAFLHRADVAGGPHVDEVDHHQSADIPEPELPGPLDSRLEIGAVRGLLDARFPGLPGVHIDGGERFGLVDDNGPTRGQANSTLVDVLDLIFEVVPREQRPLTVVELDELLLAGHHALEVARRALEDLLAVDQHLADVRGEQIPDGPQHQVPFAEDQRRGLGLLGGPLDLAPEAHQIAQVAGERGLRLVNAGGADDEAEPLLQVELLENLLQPLPPRLGLDLPGDTPGGTAGQEDQVAPRQREEGRQGRWLATKLFLDHLDHHFLAGLQVVADPRPSGRGTGVLARPVAWLALAGREHPEIHLVEGKKPRTAATELHEGSLQRGVDVLDDALVDVAFQRIANTGLDLDPLETSITHDGDATLFFLSHVDEHEFGHGATITQRSGGRGNRFRPDRAQRSEPSVMMIRLINTASCGTSSLTRTRPMAAATSMPLSTSPKTV